MAAALADFVVETRAGYAYQIPTQYFLDEVLPPLHPVLNVDKVLGTMRRSGGKGRHPITKEGRWRGFPKDPEESLGVRRRRHPPFKFAHFTDMTDAIIKAGARYGASPSFKVSNNLVQCVDFDRAQEEALPDAFIVPYQSNQDDPIVTIEDVTAVGQYTPFSDQEAKDDVCAYSLTSSAS